MSSQRDDFNPEWPEDDEDRRALQALEKEGNDRNRAESVGGSVRGRGNRSPTRSRSRSRSPVMQSAVRIADGNIDSRIEKALDRKMDEFLSKVQHTVSGRANQAEEGLLAEQLESMQLTQKEIKRSQIATKMKTDGGRYQYMALSEVKGKLEAADKIVKTAISNAYTMSAAQMLQLAQQMSDMKSTLNKRMDLVCKADSLPNGFRVLTAYQKKVEDSHLSADPEAEKLWNETVKAVDRERKEREKRSGASSSSGYGRHQSQRKGVIIYLIIFSFYRSSFFVFVVTYQYICL